MRLFYLICIGIVLLSGIGSLYLYLDTKRFSENLQKTPHRLKALTGAPTTLQEKIERAEASNKLFPNPTTQRTLTQLYAARSYEIDKIMPFVDTPKDERFADVIPFFEGKRPEEGFRALRAVNPNRAAVLEQFLLQESEKNPSS